MLKKLALAGMFFFASAVSTTAVVSARSAKASSSVQAPTSPQPKGFCYPAGMPC
jgi:hypothetical protein